LSTSEVVCSDLPAKIEEFREEGFRLDLIYPADDPCTAELSRGGETVRLTTRPGAERPPRKLPPFEPQFVLTRAAGNAGAGRAGMLYRDVIPGRLGARYIASHITIPKGGPVADWVHFHHVALQLIHVRRGWVRVVYEDQGEPFVMNAGDLVLQPRGIRHRVLESSPGLEVVEVSCPAVHETFADHELELPNAVPTQRNFGNQRFLWHVAAKIPWSGFAGGEAQETEVAEATGGLAEVRTIRGNVQVPAHDGELVFGFVLDGSGTLDYRGGQPLASGDAFVIPPGEAWGMSGSSDDFRLLHVTTARLD
jgi:quercetin dioxygenase-like cupin family protein